MLRGSLDGMGVWGRMDACICMAEFLHCSPETTTTLLTGSERKWKALTRESIPRQVDKKSRVPEEEEEEEEEEEKRVWGSQGGDRGLKFSRRKGQTFSPTFLSKDYITIRYPAWGHVAPSWKSSDQSCYLKMHIVGVSLVRSLKPWDILLIYCNNQLKKYLTPLLTLARGAFSVPLPVSMSEAFPIPFHFNKTLLHKSSWVIKPGPWSRS